MSEENGSNDMEAHKKYKSERLRLERRHKYYYNNVESERKKARERATKRPEALASETPQEADLRKEKHREHQARYRNTNKEKIRNDRFFERELIKFKHGRAAEAAAQEEQMQIGGKSRELSK